MSSHAIACRSCRRILATKHHGGRLHVIADVGVVFDPAGQFGPFLRLTCVCGEQRDYTAAQPPNQLVVHSAQESKTW